MDNLTLRELSSRVSRYFLDFLESDFKRQSTPRRKITLQTEAGFRAGMKITPYPGLNSALWKALSAPATVASTFKIAPGAYTRPMTASLKEIIRQQILAISEERVNAVRTTLANIAESTHGNALDDPEQWVEVVRASFATSIGEQIVHPLLSLLDGPLSQQAYSAVDSIFSSEAELIERIGTDLDAVLPELLARALAIHDFSKMGAAAEMHFTLSGVQSALLGYFENYATADAFLEFRDLDTYARTAEGKQLYLYIGSVKYAGAAYPLFFVPVDVARLSNGGYELTLTTHVYANKRAIDFVLQETANRQRREWVSPIDERISYLSPAQSIHEVVAGHFGRIAEAMDLGGKAAFGDKNSPDASTSELTLSSTLYLAVFDSADEALLNDYEEILAQIRKEEPGVVELFEGIIRSVIMDNPEPIGPAIESEWDAMTLVDRLVFEAPIPLNEEQIKILKAVRREEGKFILVEGPPGCGKSHTITAIASDCILNRRSCLVLSDKREALDVVQDKVSETMSRVRHDPEFPNPILRLGQQQTNFRKLISSQTLGKVSAYVKSANANQARVNAELAEKQSDLRSDISQTTECLGGLPIKEIATVFRLESQLNTIDSTLAADIATGIDASLLTELAALSVDPGALKAYFEAIHKAGGASDTETFHRHVRRDAVIAKLLPVVKRQPLALLPGIGARQARQLSAWLHEYDQLKMPVLGYLLRGSAVRRLEQSILVELSPSRPIRLKQDFETLRLITFEVSRLKSALDAEGIPEDELTVAYQMLSGAKQVWSEATHLGPIVESMFSSAAGIPLALIAARPAARFVDIWLLALSYAEALNKTSQCFAKTPQFDYLGAKTDLERLRTLMMNTEVDSRLVAYMDNYRTDARALAALIAERQKFPEEKFDQVKESFPLILASIRDFGEYMPLMPNLFDVVVIDEASQVSIAQALPALLRAKKVVVLGDSKQFSNTKSSNASIALNDKYRSELKSFFMANVSSKDHILRRLDQFDVKRSVLEFVKSCANIEIMLRKHFRSYQELISYSSKTFYGGELQAIKVRGCPIGDVIRFTEVDPSGGKVTRGTNEAEGQFILGKLIELLDEAEPPSVGIITPFREQQTYLSKLLFGDLRGADFESRLKLKVMTFDSCQGEERQIIFYSMVATEEQDMLNYIFPVDLQGAEEMVEEKLKAQRLNVGFSRAQEMIWFVLSKPIDQYRGSIAQVLRHYARIEETRPSEEDTDPLSPMESKVLDWLYQTRFFQQHEEDIEVVPQFPIGDYLRQLDAAYHHPAYKCDFLLTYSGEGGPVRIIIEYDGFEYHFASGSNVNVGNYEKYMYESDIERQLILESYGYRFLRINRFNIGNDPVETLSDRLYKLTAKVFSGSRSEAVDSLQRQAQGLSSKEMKPCSRCGQIKEHSEFFDPSLKAQYGRVCQACKAEDKARVVAQRGRSQVKHPPVRRWR